MQDDRPDTDRDDAGAEFDSQLLTDVDKWWEFLDPITYEVNEGSHARGVASATADRLDWTAVRSTERRGPVGFGFFHRCADCGRPVPPDITFCVHCGGQPHGIRTTQPYTVIIKRFEDDDAVETCIELLQAGAGEVSPAELRHMTARPPVVFNVRARREEVAALVARLSEIGIYSRSFSTDDPSIPWFSETFESFLRRPGRSLLFVAIAALTMIFSVTFSWGVLPFGLIALGFFFNLQMQWFKGRCHFAIGRLLRAVTGFDSGRATEAASLLKGLRDDEVRGSLTVALMEYYTLQQTLRTHEGMYGRAIEGTRELLVELLDQILQSCARFQRIERFLGQARPSEMEARIASLRQELRTAPDAETRGYLQRELDAVIDHFDTHQRLQKIRDDFRTRLRAMTRSLEALRSRLDTVRANVSARWEDVDMEKILAELDDELVVFEQTFEEIEMAAPRMTVGR